VLSLQKDIQEDSAVAFMAARGINAMLSGREGPDERTRARGFLCSLPEMITGMATATMEGKERKTVREEGTREKT
jgi:hypothetical protein